MARVLHTADVHLHTDAPERTAALRTVLDLAESRDAEVVTIGGDLFDRPDDVEALRSELRNDPFSDRSVQILVVPGNHDAAAFRRDVFFGDACTVLTGDPYESWTSPEGDLRIVGLPYRERADDDLLLSLRDRPSFDGTDVLLLHCSLDAPLAGDGTGDESERRYFPVSQTVLADLDFDYYFAGHYHGAHHVVLPNGAGFTYPGTPASTRESEVGRRRVSLLDPATGLSFESLDAFHYARERFTVAPGEESSVLARVERWADEYAASAGSGALGDAANDGAAGDGTDGAAGDGTDGAADDDAADGAADDATDSAADDGTGVPPVDAAVTVEGFVDRDEQAFHEDLQAAAAPASVTDETRSVAHLREHPLVASFEAELAATDWNEETRDAVRRRTLAVVSELSARGSL